MKALCLYGRLTRFCQSSIEYIPVERAEKVVDESPHTCDSSFNTNISQASSDNYAEAFHSPVNARVQIYAGLESADSQTTFV